jgi:TonB family protein
VDGVRPAGGRPRADPDWRVTANVHWDMHWLGKINCFLALCACVPLAIADESVPNPRWIIKGDPDLTLLASKSELEACIVRTRQFAHGSPPHTLSVGVYVDSAGRPVNVAVLESSGRPELDDATLDCVRRGRFKMQGKPGETHYMVFSEAWANLPPPTVCEPGMKPVAVITVALSPDQTIDYDKMPAAADSLVCACFREGEQELSQPVLLSSSGNARLDYGASGILKMAARRKTPADTGCQAYRVHFKK